MGLFVSGGFRYPEGRHGGAELRYRAGLPVLTVSGGPAEIGAAVGALALRPAPRMAAYPASLLRKYRAGWLVPVLARLGEWMVRRFEPAYREELDAIASAAGVERRWLVIGNTLFDLKKVLACSAVAVEGPRSATGAPLLARNLDYPSEGYAHEYSLVTVYRPRGKLAFASVGFPGLVGVLSGMNEAGLALAVLEVYQSPLFVRRLDPGGVPYGLCLRQVLEECATIEEARAMLSRLRRTTLYNLALADRGRAAVFEVTPARVHERRAEGGVCTCTNHFRLPALQCGFPLNFYRTFDRQRTLGQAKRRWPRFGVPELHRSLHAASQGDHTLQTMVFEPAALRLHLAAGELPASAGPLRTLELGELFRG